MKKVEFSKVIFLIVNAVTLAVTAFTLFIVWETKDTTPLSYLITAVFAELATATGFYYNKAKVENKIKLRQTYGAEIYNDVEGEDF